MKILTVDDHALVRQGLRQVLKGLDEQIEVFDAANCSEAFEVTRAHPDLDLVLLDYHLPDMDGLAALQVFSRNHPELPIIVLSGASNPTIMRQVLVHGAAGFVTKSGLADELLQALRLVLAGGVYLPPELRNAPAHEPPTPPLPENLPAPQFAPRQQQVLQLLLNGDTNKDISRALQMSEETVKNHVSAILRGFGVQTRTQAVLAANRYGYKAQTDL